MANYLALAAESALAVFGVRSVYEQPRYEVVATEEDGRNAAFRLLAGYIFGKNRGRAEIAMTTPVATAPAGREIAMTSPVATAAAGPGRWTQRFFLPASLTAATAPVPDDPRVRVVEVPAETLASITFSGLAGAETLREKTRALLGALATSAWRPDGEPATLFYDPPFTIPPLRRNEVAVAVRPAG